MKKSTLARLFALLLCLLLTLAGCSSDGEDAPDQQEEQQNNDQQDNQEDNQQEDNSDQPQGETFTYDHMTIVVPEGFTVDESGSFPILYPPTYPDETDNINITMAGADNIDNYTQDVLESYYSSAISGFGGITDFEKTTVDGVDALRCSYQVTTSGVTMTGTQYYVFGEDYTDIITFTSVTGAYDTAFEQCAASITMD